MQDIVRVPAFVSPVSLKWCRAQHLLSLIPAVGVDGVDVERALSLETLAIRLAFWAMILRAVLAVTTEMRASPYA